MSGYQDRLQGTDRLLRIRRIRKAVFAGLLALTIVLIFARLEGEGASLKPLFLPVNGILEVALIMGLTTSIVGLFLRNLEIRNALARQPALPDGQVLDDARVPHRGVRDLPRGGSSPRDHSLPRGHLALRPASSRLART